MEATSNHPDGLLSPEQFQEIVRRQQKRSRLTHGYYVFGTVAIFIFAIVTFVALDGEYVLLPLFLLAAAACQLYITIRFKKYIADDREIAELPQVMDAAENLRNPTLYRYVRFLKDGKWGLYDITLHRVTLNPVYDDISWVRRGVSLLVTAGGTRQRVNIGRFNGEARFLPAE